MADTPRDVLKKLAERLRKGQEELAAQHGAPRVSQSAMVVALDPKEIAAIEAAAQEPTTPAVPGGERTPWSAAQVDAAARALDPEVGAIIEDVLRSRRWDA